MGITTKLALASILALGFAAPVQAQNPQQGDYYRFQQWTSSRGCRNKRALHKSGEFDRAITTSNFATVLKIKTPRRFFWGFLLVRAGTNYAEALCGQRRRAMRAAMITFRSPSAHVSYWRKSGNTCRKRGVDCCSA